MIAKIEASDPAISHVGQSRSEIAPAKNRTIARIDGIACFTRRGLTGRPNVTRSPSTAAPEPISRRSIGMLLIFTVVLFLHFLLVRYLLDLCSNLVVQLLYIRLYAYDYVVERDEGIVL
jgi:hypothetical protein